MSRPIISLIVATDSKGGIGRDNKIPWYLPEDIKRFKDLTMGHPVIMGRKTFESIISYLKKPLPGRVNIVVTRNPDFAYDGVIVCKSIDEAIEKALNIDKNEILIGGGEQIFNSTVDMADRLYLTIIKGDFKADTFFSHADKFKKVVSKEEKSYKGINFTFLTLERQS
ncbi:MAG: dihydrofolate reductase [Patescibacteria group bacterium]